MSASPRTPDSPVATEPPQQRLRAWWLDTLGLTVALILATLALYEAVSSAPGLSGAARSWLSAIGVALIVAPLFAFTLYRRQVDNKVLAARPARRTGASGGPHRKVRLTILSALAVIALVTTLTVAVEQHAISGMYSIGDAMNIAGRQRTLSQQIHRLVKDARRSPIDSIEFVAATGRLQFEADSLDRLVGPMLSFNESEARLAEAARREARDERLALLRTIADFHTGRQSEARVGERADALLLAQDQFVTRLAALASMNIHRIRRATWTFGLLLFAVLLGIGLLVVEPVVRLLRHQHEAVAARSLEFERLAMVAQRTSTSVVITDADRRIVWVNGAFTRLTGWTFDEAQGRRPGDLLQAPESDPETIAHMRRELNAGRPVRTTILNKAKDGTRYWLDLSIEPLTENGVITGFLAVESDVSESIRVQTALEHERESLERTTALLAESQTVARMGNWSMDLASDRVEWSDSTYSLFGRALNEGHPRLADAVNRYTPASVAAMQAAIAQARQTGQSFSLVLQTAGLNPAVRWIRADGRARRDAQGAVTGLYGILVDVTESVEREAALRDAQERADAANRSKSEFLANMSHEIRTPLTAIIGYADWLREDSAEVVSGEQQRALDTIHRASSHLLAVINDILDLSKIEAGRVATESVETILPAVLLDVESIARARAAGKGVSLETRLLSPIPERVVTDPTRLRQILMNLVGNAVKFTEHGRVRVDVRTEQATTGQVLVVTIEDTGVGMTEAQVRDLFQPFQQGDASVTRRFGGTGLGLSISRRLAGLLGGDVRVVWSVPDKGSCFAVTLPLEAVSNTPIVERLAATAPGVAPVPAPNALAGVRLLLAEDGEDNQRLLRMLFETAGAHVTVAVNGVQALEALEWAAEAGAPFEILVTDMQMPVMDGYTLASTIRARGGQIPIIALTAHAMAEDRVRCLDAGCSDYAVKPVNRPALIALVAKWTRSATDAPFVESAPAEAVARLAALPPVVTSDLADDPDLGPLAAAFALVLPDRIEAIRTEFEQADRSTGCRLVHQLKGAAGSYGYPLISSLAGELEHAWERESDADALLDQLRVLAERAALSPSASAQP